VRTLPKNTSGVVNLHACAAQPLVPALKRRNNRNQVGFGGVRRVPAALAGACAAAAISISTEPALTLASARLPRWLCQNRDTPHLDNELSGAGMRAARGGGRRCRLRVANDRRNDLCIFSKFPIPPPREL